MNFLLTFLLLNTTFSWSNCASIEFKNMSEDNWQLLIGANSKELKYDFCKYNATSQGTQCTNFEKFASTDIGEVCNCSVQHTKTKAGSFTFSVNCLSNSSWCPKDLLIQYQQGPSEKPSHAEEISATKQDQINFPYLSLPLVVLVCLIVGVLVKYREQVVHSCCTEKRRQYDNGSSNDHYLEEDQRAEQSVAFQDFPSASFVQPVQLPKFNMVLLRLDYWV